MAHGINPVLAKILMNGSKEERLFLCSQHPAYFEIYYFSEYLTHKMAPFHFDMYDDMIGLAERNIDTAIWCMYRGSAKTSKAKIFLIWCIVFKKFNYIVYDSFNSENPRSALFDIITELQTNELIKSDFGSLFNDAEEEATQGFGGKKLRAKKQKKLKKRDTFITENGIKVQAASTQQSLRGLLFKGNRPDLIVFDDFETNLTKHSIAMTNEVQGHIDEAKGALAPNHVKLFLCNYITEDGTVSKLLTHYKNNPLASTRFIAILDKDGNSTWGSKFVLTDAEAKRINDNITDARRMVVSIEHIRRDMGEAAFQIEYMNNPRGNDSKIFTDDVIASCINKSIQPIGKRGDINIFSYPNPTHVYTIGADVSAGVGEDSSTAVVIDLTEKPAKVVATFASNRISPMDFATLLGDLGEYYYGAIVAVEANGVGFGTVTRLNEIYNNVYVNERNDKDQAIETKQLGWMSSRNEKKKAVYELQDAISKGRLYPIDRNIINEMNTIRSIDFDRTLSASKLTTQHNDLFMAFVIAWLAKSQAMQMPSTKIETYEGEPQYVLDEPVRIEAKDGYYYSDGQSIVSGFNSNSLDVYE